jgi:hypothetical protein
MDFSLDSFFISWSTTQLLDFLLVVLVQSYEILPDNEILLSGPKSSSANLLCLAVTSLCHVIQAKGMLEVKRLAVELRV